MPNKDEYQCRSFFNEDKKEERQYELYQGSTYKEINILWDFFKRREAIKSNCLYDKSLALLL